MLQMLRFQAYRGIFSVLLTNISAENATDLVILVACAIVKEQLVWLWHQCKGVQVASRLTTQILPL